MDFLPAGFSWNEFLFTLVIGDLLLTIISVLIADRIKHWWKERNHGGWRIQIVDGQQAFGEFAISADKQQEIAEDAAERDVFLKGRTSVFAWLRRDIAELLTVDAANRIYRIDLAGNPASEQEPWRVVARQDGAAVDWLQIDGHTITVLLDALPLQRPTAPPPATDD